MDENMMILMVILMVFGMSRGKGSLQLCFLISLYNII